MKLSIYVLDYDNLEVLFTNRTNADETVRPHCYELMRGLDARCTDDCPLQRLRGTGETFSAVRKAENGERWSLMEYNDIRTPAGKNVCIVSVADVTALQKTVCSMERLLDSIRAAAYTIQISDYRLRFLNRELRNLLPGVKDGEICYRALWDREEPCPFCPVEGVRKSGLPAHMDLFNQKLNRHLSFDVVDITDTSGEPLALFTAYDVSRLVDSENQLKAVAYMDVMTGVKNRNAFLGELKQLYEEKSQGSICLLNIKYLKKYNVLYGKKEGDKLIQDTATRFAESYSREKTYRVDGAKLAFLAVGGAEKAQMREVVGSTVARSVSGWVHPNFELSFDTVYVPFPDCAQTPEELVFNAEYLLRKCARLSSGGSMLEFDQNEKSLLNRKNRIETILRMGNYSERFRVFYQPIYNISTGSFSKSEALLRLFDEELGTVSPLEFIPIAEECGMIGGLTNFVLDEVCKFLAPRQNLSPVQVNVNVSSVEFARSQFFEDMTSTVSRWGVLPSLIQFEITESIFINSVGYVVDIMNRLIEYGFSFAIDDFGMGYSSLNYIGTMPVKCLKLDKSFMDELLRSKSCKLIVANVIEIAKGLDLSIVAEGIENTDQFEAIKELGTNFIQGYLFSKPLPLQEYEEFLENNCIPASV